jgi:hypothetical protein
LPISVAVKARHDPARLRIVGIGPPREVLDLAGPDVNVIAAAWAPRLEAIYEEARDGQPEEARG